MNQPLVSVVVPTYKRPTYLERAIASVLTQSYGNWELIVVDDNDKISSYRQETELFMEPYLARANIKYIKHERNKGGSAARNTGIEQAVGEYVAFLDDDDEWLPDKLTKQVECFANVDDATALISTGFVIVDDVTGQIKTVLPQFRGWILSQLLKRNSVGTTSTVLCRRNVLLEIGMFDENLPAKQDIDLYIRIAKNYKFDFVAEPLVRFHRHAKGNIGTNLQGVLEAHEHFHKKHSLLLEQKPKIYQYRLKWQGRLLLQLGRTEEARGILKKAFKVNPLDFETAALLAFAHLKPSLRNKLLKLRSGNREKMG